MIRWAAGAGDKRSLAEAQFPSTEADEASTQQDTESPFSRGRRAGRVGSELAWKLIV